MPDSTDPKPYVHVLEGTLAERIEKAREQARAAREAAGLPPVDDGPFTPDALRAWQKRRGKKR